MYHDLIAKYPAVVRACRWCVASCACQACPCPVALDEVARPDSGSGYIAVPCFSLYMLLEVMWSLAAVLHRIGTRGMQAPQPLTHKKMKSFSRRILTISQVSRIKNSLLQPVVHASGDRLATTSSNELCSKLPSVAVTQVDEVIQ